MLQREEEEEKIKTEALRGNAISHLGGVWLGAGEM